MDGTVIAALAVLETPDRINTDHPQRKDISELELGKSDPTNHSDAYSESRLEDRRHLLRNSRQQLLWGVLTYFGGFMVGSALSYTLDNRGRPLFAIYLDGISSTLPWTLVFGAMTIGFSNAYSSNAITAITAERSVARRHMQSRNFWPNYPGLNFFAVYMILAIPMAALATRLVANERLNFPTQTLTKMIVGLLLTNLHMAWVHAVISKTNKKSFWQRIPGRREWIEIIPAASLDLASPNFVYYLAKKILAFSAFESFIFIPVALQLLTSILTRAIFIRVAASMLPDDDEPVILFDYSFGGRARNNETYCLSILDAMNTMRMQDWNCYRKIVREVLQYEISFVFLFIIAIALEFYFEKPCTAGDLLELFASMFLVE